MQTAATPIGGYQGTLYAIQTAKNNMTVLADGYPLATLPRPVWRALTKEAASCGR